MIAAALLLAAAPPVMIPPLQPKTEQYGDWTVTPLENGSAIAAVANNAGSSFGTICDAESCVAFFNPKATCAVGSKYPALVNAPGGTFSAVLECEKLDDLLLLSFDLNEDVREAMAVGGVLGIAFPMASGEFKVARFSLTGAARAAARASQIAGATTPNERSQASDNSTL